MSLLGDYLSKNTQEVDVSFVAKYRDCVTQLLSNTPSLAGYGMKYLDNFLEIGYHSYPLLSLYKSAGDYPVYYPTLPIISFDVTGYENSFISLLLSGDLSSNRDTNDAPFGICRPEYNNNRFKGIINLVWDTMMSMTISPLFANSCSKSFGYGYPTTMAIFDALVESSVIPDEPKVYDIEFKIELKAVSHIYDGLISTIGNREMIGDERELEDNLPLGLQGVRYVVVDLDKEGWIPSHSELLKDYPSISPTHRYALFEVSCGSAGEDRVNSINISSFRDCISYTKSDIVKRYLYLSSNQNSKKVREQQNSNYYPFLRNSTQREFFVEEDKEDIFRADYPDICLEQIECADNLLSLIDRYF